MDSDLEVADRGRSGQSYPSRHPLPQQNYSNLTQKEAVSRSAQMTEPIVPKHRNPFGWSPLVLGTVVCLITAIIVGAVVGGGVGGALASKSSCPNSNEAQSTSIASTTCSIGSGSSTSSTSTAASASATALTDWIPPPIANIESLHTPCNGIDGNSYNTNRGQKFMYTCYNLRTAGDVGSIFVYTIDACIEACSSLNHWADINEVGDRLNTCVYAHFVADIRGSYGSQYTNCWLKSSNATIYTTSGELGRAGALLVS